MPGNLVRDVELLLNDGSDTLPRRQVDEGAHLGAEHAALYRAFEQRLEVRHWLHQVDAVLFRRQALVHLDEGHHPPVFPQIGRNRLALHLAVHGALEQDGSENLLSVEGGRGDDAHPKFVHDLEHLRLAGICRECRRDAAPPGSILRFGRARR